MPELLVMRHAKSAWDTDAPSDFDRPLAARGERDKATMARWVIHQGLTPDLVLSSSAVRARDTAQHVADTCRLESDQVIFDRALYDAGFRQWLGRLRAQTAARVMICGHNPHLDLLVETLSADPLPLSASGKLMTTAAIAHLSFDGEWADLKPAMCGLHALVRPREL